MSKKNKKEQGPYKLNLVISLDGLDGVPKDTKPQEISRNWLVKSVLLHGEANKGFNIQNQKMLRRIRVLFQEVLDSGADTAEMEVELWRFFKRCWDSVNLPGGANEVIMRINDNIEKCQSEHDRAESGADTELAEGESEPVSSQEQ